MKKLFLAAITAASLASGSHAFAGTTDPQGMPVFYLRGNFNQTNWAPTENYRFTRSGNDYSLAITSSNAIGQCEFKIADDNWDIYNIGADVTVNTSGYVDGFLNGPNMKTNGLRNAVISFTYDGSSPFTTVKFVVNGVEPEPQPDPDPADYPAVYLRGDFNETGWAINGAYKFSCSDGIYTLNIGPSNPIPAGSHFKIGTEDWSTVDLGAPSEGVAVDYTQNIMLTRGGPNLTTVNGIYEGSISFAYVPDAYDMTVSFTIPGTQRPPVAGLSGTLPVLYINVYADEAHTALNNEIISKDLNHKDYFKFAEYWLDVNGCEWLQELGAEDVGSEEKPLALQIKARGNWTRIGFSKKPFKLKLDKKQSLLGLSKSKHFAILAHADDNKGYLRNFVGFNLGKRAGLPWTPSQQPVEVVINGDYRGLYFLTESIRVEEDRVNITELKDNEMEGKLLSGGYIVELDNYDEDEEAQIRMEEKHCASGGHFYDKLRITFDTPEVYSPLQRQFITDQFTAMNNYVGSNSDLLWSYIDLDDAARYYLVEEIVSHTESFHGSTYLFRDYGDGQKWHFSPLWDFGNAFNGSTSDFFYNCDPYGNTWIPSMRENKKFNDKVKETWLWFMSSQYQGLEDDIDEYVGHLKAAAQADFKRWEGKPVPGGGQPVADNRDLSGKRNEVVSHLNSKIQWLKTQFGDYSSALYDEPERDTTEAAELPSYVATNVVEIIDMEADGEVEYYSLQGVRLTNPQPGSIVIVRKGGKAVKAMIR